MSVGSINAEEQVHQEQFRIAQRLKWRRLTALLQELRREHAKDVIELRSQRDLAVDRCRKLEREIDELQGGKA